MRCPTCDTDLGERRVLLTEVKLSTQCERILRFMLLHEGRWLEYEEIMASMQGHSNDKLNQLKVQIHNINKKILPRGYRIVNARYRNIKGPRTYKLEQFGG